MRIFIKMKLNIFMINNLNLNIIMINKMNRYVIIIYNAKCQNKNGK